MAGFEGELAEWFAGHATASAFNAHYDRPAVLELCGDVRGARVLDVGCGAGHTAAELTARGAEVVGVDGSATLLAHARERFAGELVEHDLERPLAFAAADSFDGAVMALVLHHVDDRDQLLRELARVVRPGGWLVVSTHHPTSDWRHLGGSYFAHERTTVSFGGGRWRVPAWRMPLQDLLEELTAPGFALERLVEPRPRPELADLDPEVFARLSREPGFLALRVRRNPG